MDDSSRTVEDNNSIKIGKIGGLYQIKKFDWMIYPSRDIADKAHHLSRHDGAAVATFNRRYDTEKWKKRLGCNVSSISANTIFLLLEVGQERSCRAYYRKILTNDGQVGWIIYQENEEWIEGSIEEVKTE
jgi:hypothetical protein